MGDGIFTLPYGHFKLREEVFQNLLIYSPDWGQDENTSVSPGVGSNMDSTFTDFIEGGNASG